MKNKRLLFIVIVVLLFVCMAMTILFCLSAAEDSIKNEDFTEDTIGDDNLLFRTGWNKSYTNYSNDFEINIPKEIIDSTFIIVKKETIEFCTYDKYYNNVCEIYHSKIDSDKLIVSLPDNKEIEYTYEIVSEQQLVLTYYSNNSTFVTKYNMVLG